MSESDQIQIRDARDDERGAIRELTMAAYQEYATVMAPSAWAGLHDVLTRVLDTYPPAERIVAERGGALVGSVMLSPPDANIYVEGYSGPDWPEIRLLAVAPSARGMGVGAALTEECMRRAERSGARRIGLHTSDSLRAAIRMYERMGFVRAPEHDFRPEGAELVMAYYRDL